MLCKVRFIALITLIGVVSTASFATDQYVKQGATGSGASWDDALGSIQDAIDAAEVDDTVYVSSGTYYENITMKSGVSVLGGYEGVSGSPGIRDIDLYITTIDGSTARDGSPAYHVVMMNSVTNTAFGGFTITGGNANGEVTEDECGGGVYCYYVNETNTIEDCRIAANIAKYRGGGMCLDSSHLAMMRCYILDNEAKGSINTVVGGMYLTCSNPALTDCVISGNTTFAFYSSGIGGMSLSDSNPALVNCIIRNNFGGGLWAGGCGGMSLSRSNPTLINCIINSNSGIDGGGMSLGYSSPALINCTLSNNHSNRAGISIGSDSYPEIVNTIIEGHSGYGIHEGSSSSNPTAISHCLFFNNTNGDYYDYDNGSQIGGATINANVAEATNCFGGDPLFENKADGNYRLQNGSAALDRGLLSRMPATDIAGVSRPGSDGLADIGAYEAPAAYTPAPDTNPPVSSILTIPELTTSEIFELSYSVVDVDRGVQYVRLYYHKEGGEWTQYGGNYTASPISFNSSSTGGDGNYEFYTRGMDNAGNFESAPAEADVHTFVAGIIGPVVCVKTDATGNGTGIDWVNACNTISFGLTIAEAHGTQEVWVAGGTYSEVITMPSNVMLRGGYEGLSGTSGIRDIDLYVTIIDGSTARNGEPAYHVVTMRSTTSATLEGFTITGGNADGGFTIIGLQQSEYYDPYSSIRCGSGVYCSYVNATNTIANCQIIGNEANYGGGLGLENSNPTVIDCMIDGNEAISFLYHIYQNHQYRLGGGLGGGIFLKSSHPTLSNCVFFANTASVNGGGIYLDSSDPTVINCTLSGNHCEDSSKGGGIYIGDNSQPVILNTIFEGNTDHAIYEGDYTSFPTMLSHCLFYNNADGDYYDNETGSLSGATTINLTLTGAKNCVDGDPLFLDAANGDFHLQEGSAAIDFGTSISAPVTDMDGVARPMDRYGVGFDGENEGYDIGVYEYLFAGVLPAPPSDIAAISATIESITWGWQDNSDNEAGFTIYFTTGTELSWAVADILAADSTSWSTGSLVVNTQYPLGVRAFSPMGAGNRVQGAGWTLALPPVAPMIDNPSRTSLDVTIGAGDGNPAYTEYALYSETMGQWAQADGTLGPNAVWKTAADWGTATVSGFSGGTLHRIAVMARNGDGIETALGPAAKARTQMMLTYIAAPCGIIEGESVQWIDYGGDGAPVMAVPVLGNFFVDWSDGLTTTTRTDTNITSDLNFTANFNPGAAWILCK
ncbi:right-handed parallel beta-helix repeat-containing protein [Candidatus Sumerlaeota bacterium]|nr:right-handed parallel beta-helix repeat-containing protein [Candidatus Sumerlaeota bacterium]